MNNTRNCNFILIIAPSAPPQNFTAIGGENISLTWIPPPFIDQNGVLVDYFIEYFGIERDTHTRNTTIPSSQHYSIIFGLDPRKFTNSTPVRLLIIQGVLKLFVP